ncbi:MAG: C40 family peptidase [Lachnospiraceae bacterium]|nr:C40 family peptidase [Lachnospiraceae bacterium]
MNRQWISAILMTVVGGCIFAVSDLYRPQLTVAVVSETENDTSSQMSVTSLSETEITTDTRQTEEETKEEFSPAPDELNLAHYFPEGVDMNDLSKSYAGKAFIELMTQDGLWMNSIYDYADLTPEQLSSRLGMPRSRVMGDYNPKDDKHDPDNPNSWTINSFRNIRTKVTDGDGKPINAYSNVIEIMSVANVYSYYKNVEDYDLFLSCAKALWKVSHSYSISMSEVYYCDGCLSEEDERARLEREAEAEEEAVRKVITQVGKGFRGIQAEEEATKDSEQIRESMTAKETEGKSDISTVNSIQETNNLDNITTIHESVADGNESEENVEESSSTSRVVIQPASTEEAMMMDSSSELNQQDLSGGETSSSVLIAGQSSTSPLGENTETTQEGAEASPSNGSEPESIPENHTYENNKKANDENKNRKKDSDDPECPGHVDLIIHMKICGIKEENGLFKRDPYGNDADNRDENGWEGWTQETMDSARRLSSQDWYQKYGMTISAFSMRNPLTGYEIEEYMERLPDDISDTRRDIIRFALSSVGKVPYYWGGKPSAPNYSRNNFGTLITPDEKGRILRGLDCSGWVNWVYWSVTGSRLPYESTSGLALCGSPISRDNLQPGDIIIRTGESAHVIIFLEWTDDGRIRCIHESSGDVNNVTVAVRDANWPYYRKLID